MYNKKGSMSLGTGIIYIAYILIITLLTVTYASDLSAVIADMYTQSKNKETLQSLGGKIMVPDMFSRAYTVAQENEIVIFFESTEYISRYINMVYSCDTQFSDIMNILWVIHPDFQEKVTQMIINRPDAEAIRVPTTIHSINSCIKINACKERIPIERYIDTTNARRNCETTIQNLNTYVSTNKDFLHRFDQGNIGEERFQNGTLEDSEYDLMIDIQTIADILFENNTQTQELIFYRLPAVRTRTSGINNAPRGSTNTTSTSETTTRTSTGSRSDMSNNENNSNDTENTMIATEGQRDIRLVPPSTPTITQDTQIDAFINATNTRATPPPSTPTNPARDSNFPVSNPGFSLVGNACVPAQSFFETTPLVTTSAPIIEAETYMAELISGFAEANTQDVINETLAQQGINDTVPDVVPTPTTGQSIPEVPSSPPGPAPDVSTVTELFDLYGGTDQSCIDRCQNLSAIDKVACISACMCGMVSSKNDIFRIRFCRIPASKTTVTKEKSVLSIEEIIREMHTLFTDMKDSGQTIKNYKPREFLESSQNKNQFANMFAFNITITTKPLFDKTRTDEKVSEQRRRNTQYKHAFLQIYDDTTLDKNKYIIMSDIASNEQTQEPVASTENRRNDQGTNMSHLTDTSVGSIADDTIRLAQDGKIAGVSHIVTDFLARNLLFWQETHDLMKEMNAVSRDLRKKIEKAKD